MAAGGYKVGADLPLAPTAPMADAKAKRLVGPISTKEKCNRCVLDLKKFLQAFIKEHRDKFERLPAKPPAGNATEEQEHQWYEVFNQYVSVAESQMQSTADKWGLLKPPEFNTDFIEYASEKNDLDDFLRSTEYAGFISAVRKTLYQEAEAEEALLKLPKEVRQIDERLQAIDLERAELLKQRNQLLGCSGTSNAVKDVRGAIEIQRYKDDVGLD
mmetsp:Transcript_51914/g.91190  ORF Transcript_51914/g.91190 Transcript_51914/m.91190 type:complete len:215 (-) Transcript_51914:30-674(-)